MDEQSKYKKFVKKYFDSFDIKLPADMTYFYTPCVKETDRIYFPLERKVDGKYVDAGAFIPEFSFVGDYETSFFTYTWTFARHYPQSYESRDLGDYKCMVKYKREVFKTAIFITKFV